VEVIRLSIVARQLYMKARRSLAGCEMQAAEAEALSLFILASPKAKVASILFYRRLCSP
jgi:hypothetical protein